MALRSSPIQLTVRLMLFALLMLLYQLSPLLGWAAMGILTMYLTARFFSRTSQAH